jgi:hypothetical protein
MTRLRGTFDHDHHDARRRLCSRARTPEALEVAGRLVSQSSRRFGCTTTHVPRPLGVDVPTPELGAGDAPVRPIVATCDLDTQVIRVALLFPDRSRSVTVRRRRARRGSRCWSRARRSHRAVPDQLRCWRSVRGGLTGSCMTAGAGAAFGMADCAPEWGGAQRCRVRKPYADAMLVPLPASLDPAAVAACPTRADGWRRRRTVACAPRQSGPRHLAWVTSCCTPSQSRSRSAANG